MSADDGAVEIVIIATNEGIVQVGVAGAVDDDATAQLRSLLGRLPVTVPVVIDLGDRPRPDAGELGQLLSLVRTASFDGRAIAISAADDDLRSRMTAIAFDRFARLTSTADEGIAALTSPTSVQST